MRDMNYIAKIPDELQSDALQVVWLKKTDEHKYCTYGHIRKPLPVRKQQSQFSKHNGCHIAWETSSQKSLGRDSSSCPVTNDALAILRHERLIIPLLREAAKS